MKKAILLCVAFFWASLPAAKAQTKIQILSSDITDIQKQPDGSRTFYLRGNVGLKQDVAIMTCDSAILTQPENTFQAFKNVRIVQADTTVVTGDFLDYSGESRTFIIRQNVELQTPSSTLKTTALSYNRNNNTAYYTTRSTLYKKDLELTSDRGSYNTDYETVWLRGNVEAIDPEYTLFTDTLLYYPNRNTYNFAGPSVLNRDSTVITCKLGEYAAESSQLQLGNGATITSPGSFIKADSVNYFLKTESGELFEQALVADTAQGFVLESDYIDYKKQPNFVDASYPVYYRQRMGKDTLYARGDTLHIREDSITGRKVDLVGDTRFFSQDFQGKSPFFSYFELQERLHLFPNPLMWNKQNQFECDSAVLTLVEEELDSLYLIENVRIVSQTKDSIHYDGAVGKLLRGVFEENKLRRLRLEGNAQNLSHSLSSENTVEGINQAACGWITIQFQDGQASRLNASNTIEASYTPWDAVSEDQKSLPGCTPKFEQQILLKDTRPLILAPESP